jgi:hypothetical protein
MQEVVYSAESQLRSPARFAADTRADPRVSPALNDCEARYERVRGVTDARRALAVEPAGPAGVFSDLLRLATFPGAPQ